MYELSGNLMFKKYFHFHRNESCGKVSTCWEGITMITKQFDTNESLIWGNVVELCNLRIKHDDASCFHVIYESTPPMTLIFHIIAK